MQTPRAALVFAAGFGTRMRPLTDTMPKPLVRVAGKTLLDHALDLARDADLQRIVVNTHYRHDQIAAHLSGRDIALSHEAPEILDTGGGLRHALPRLGQPPVFTMNSDAVWRGENPLAMLTTRWDPARMDALLLCVPPDRVTGHGGGGDFTIAPDGQLIRGGKLVYSGVQIINPVGIHDIEDSSFSLNLLWNRLAAHGRLHGMAYDGHWCDVGHPGGIALAEEMLAHV